MTALMVMVFAAHTEQLLAFTAPIPVVLYPEGQG
jgi:hypothetical protein